LLAALGPLADPALQDLQPGHQRRQRVAQLVPQHRQELVLAAVGGGQLLVGSDQRLLDALLLIDGGRLTL
jgi:hypothetical protein